MNTVVSAVDGFIKVYDDDKLIAVFNPRFISSVSERKSLTSTSPVRFTLIVAGDERCGVIVSQSVEEVVRAIYTALLFWDRN